MHELSLALEVCRLAGDVRDRQAATRVLSVGVEVGEEAGVEIENFRFCLETLLRDPPWSGARADLLPGSGETLRLAYVEIEDDGPDH